MLHNSFVKEELGGKRSRNPSTSSSYSFSRAGGYRSRRASEGDEGASVRGGTRSRGSSRHNSGGMGGKPAYKGRYSDQGDWIVSGSYQEKLNARLNGVDGVGRKNPSGPRKRANSASEKVVTVTSAKSKLMPEP